ncbi:hypothetical protein A3D85_03375 [Candidatus Amesbacteria bacterium RIFCSPHIGHO2_02_FULL_47_9]|uniref:Uncharacterized protein n=1 Tax=Candidatus Amesbacteria bacterium RIFCSPHIGHO2_01_FULL_48_32b TaxID=1797253 RepID=A0A1F4YGU7_9BACT|nr:MAG: hypothetical protein A2876_00290 [Candidatus Amesbacteria bacterium RIFCSPHIGHO2_01_FULL_48_32b]OGD04187.1 MAG: hypothetical protein A3D85_03375 [Candidatus Amesbacteria bacterium RIFCSPHIGHO2_02_FULL_47_9]OGD07541.1 MAG: hypothetical protein A2899_04545 [Candidatus Amesbacteria bacterium RIFCSPLOWO2_01_FULL_49_25]
MNKILIVCGPTATGKTKFGIEMARQLNGEIVSADSRQVYTGKNLIHGKDIPYKLKATSSQLKWRDRFLKYYDVDGIKIWLYDVVDPGDEFNVAFWKECADLIIKDITSRNKLPIVVGGSGLYLESLTRKLDQISTPPNKLLRQKLVGKSVKYLFNYLNKIDSFRAAQLNISDRSNPRRLIRAIEISQSSTTYNPQSTTFNFLQIGLTAPRDFLYKLVDQRILDRLASGAALEDPDLTADIPAWQSREHSIIRHQITWFKRHLPAHWIDISDSQWYSTAQLLILNWYNKN